MSYDMVGPVHFTSALSAMVLGGFVVAQRKGTPLHRFIGIFYVFAMLLVNATALSLYHMTGYFGPFHAAALFSLASVLIGLAAAILKRGNWLRRHTLWMGWSYFGLLSAAFAEAAVRIPAFHVNSAARGFEVAIAATLLFSLTGSFFMRWLGRSLNSFKSIGIR